MGSLRVCIDFPGNRAWLVEGGAVELILTARETFGSVHPDLELAAWDALAQLALNSGEFKEVEMNLDEFFLSPDSLPILVKRNVIDHALASLQHYVPLRPAGVSIVDASLCCLWNMHCRCEFLFVECLPLN